MSKKSISTVDMPKKEWLSKRDKSIGASEAGAVMGLNPYQTPVDVYLSKIGKGLPVEENLAMWIGSKIEPLLRERFQMETGMKVRKDNKIRVDKKCDFLTTNLDGMVVGEKVPVEFKTMGVWNGDIPDYYFAQIQHQMMVTNKPYIYFAVLVTGYGKQFIIEKYERNDDFISEMRESLIKFWNNNVMRQKPPDPITVTDINNIYKNSKPDSFIEITEDNLYLVDYINQYMELSEKAKMNNNMKAETKKILMKNMQLYEHLQLAGNTVLSWKKTKPIRTFNTKAFKNDNPELYEKYVVEREGSRRFTVKTNTKLPRAL